MSKGIMRAPSNYKRGKTHSKRYSGNGMQGTLTPHLPRQTGKTDVNGFSLTVLKEVGKAICPPAALTIELLYQVYKHQDAIKEASSAIIRGEYEEAVKVLVKEGIKEVRDAAIGIALEPCAKATESMAEVATSEIIKGEQEQVKKAAVGATKGVIEAVTDKITGQTDDIIDKIVDKAIEVIKKED
jgi:hypothetical protein